MDWSRAKNIFIIVFLLLNTYLTVNIILNRNSGEISLETLKNAVDILNQRDVYLDDNMVMPSYNRETPMLVFEDTGIDREKIASFLMGSNTNGSQRMEQNGKTLEFLPDMTLEYVNKNPSDYLEVKDKKQVEKYLRKFMLKLGLPSKDFVLDEFSSGNENGKARFVYMYEGFSAFDNYVVFGFNTKGIEVMNLRHLNANGFSDKTMGIIPVHSILINNIDNYGLTSKVIENIDFGFKNVTPRSYEEGEIMKIESHSPVWRIKFTDKNEHFFYLAETGERLY